MDIYNPVINLCLKGTQAEFDRRKADACRFYQRAWEAVTDDYEACIAAHYMARCKDSAQEILYWNQKSLELANKVNDDRVKDFFPSLYLNLGRSYELLGNQSEAKRYYDLAAKSGFAHQFDE